MPSWYISGFERPRGPIFTGSQAAAATITWNTSPIGSNISLSNGNLDATKLSAVSGWSIVRGSVAKSSGKRYYEIKQMTQIQACAWGIISPSGATLDSELGNGTGVAALGFDRNGPFNAENGFTTNTPSAPSIALNDVINFAVDLDAGKMWMGLNNDYTQFKAAADPGAGANNPFSFTGGTSLTPAGAMFGVGSGDMTLRLFASTSQTLNFTPPSGFVVWDT